MHTANPHIIAIIDCGTNTFNLLVADLAQEGKKLFETKIPVKIGKGLPSLKKFSAEAMQRAIDAILQHQETAGTFGCDTIYAFATAAFRNAVNGNELVTMIQEKTGIQVAIISGRQEAEYIYQGVKTSGILSSAPSLIMDIGGGSTELIIGKVTGTLDAFSFEVGASRLLDEFSPADPISTMDIERITAHLHHLFDAFFEKNSAIHPVDLIGSSGFFDSLSDMAHFAFPGKYAFKPITNQIDIEDFRVLMRKIMPLSYAERLEIEGLAAFRADMIIVSFLLSDFILRQWNIRRLITVKYSLKEGVLASLAQSPRTTL